jgi:steroid delta-isomerase-like uncharacterized protein
MSTQANKELVSRYYQELLNGGDLSFIDKYMTPDFLFTNPTHPEPYCGQQFKQLVAMLHSAFPDIHFDVERIIAEDDIVVGRWIATGTHTGTALNTLRGDIPALGNAFTICGMSWLRIEAGRFVEARILEDTLGLLQQLGFSACIGVNAANHSAEVIPSDRPAQVANVPPFASQAQTFRLAWS